MKKLIVFLAVLAMVGVAQAQDSVKTSWTEVQVLVAGTPIGEGDFTADPSFAVANYNSDKAIGWFFGNLTTGDTVQSGPMFAWRMVHPEPMPLLGDWLDMKWSWFLYTQSDVADGAAADDLRWGLGMRLATKGSVKMEIRGQVDSREQTKTRIRPGFALVFLP